jgi:peptide deformylase
MDRPILKYGAEVLNRVALPVENITGEEVRLVEDMVHAMYRAPGVGLAAPQVGESKRIMVTDASAGEKKDNLLVILNPEIVESDGEQLEEEGCLSIPGFSERVLRPKRVVIKGVDLEGRDLVLEGTDLLARAFCHELDHLNGVLFLEHLSFLKRDLIRRRIRKLAKRDEW